MRTVVVEDAGSIRRLLETVLSERGHEVVAVEAAEQALAAHQESQADLFLVDLVLPGMGGAELVRRVRALPNGDIPVMVAFTGRPNDAALEDLLDAGVDDYLTKPLVPGELARRLTIAEAHVRKAKRRLDAERARERFEIGLKKVVDSADAPMAVHSDGVFVLVNDVMARLLGYDDPAELVGTRAIEIIHPSERDQVLERRTKLARAQTVPPERRRLLAKDGSTVVVESAGVPIVLEGKPAVLLLVHDRAEALRAQARIHQADRILSVGQLAVGVAHEINNPLAAVLTNLGILAEDEELSRRHAEVLTEAIAGAETVRDIVRDLRTFARVGTGEGPTSVRAAVETSLRLAHNQIRHRARVTTRFEPCPDVPADGQVLAQVFGNLLMSSALALPEGQAEENEIAVRVGTAPGGALVEISDTGPRLSPQELDRIFEPYSVAAGMGLDLSVCHNLIAAMGGRLDVESDDGAGRRFRVVLPAARRKPAPKPASAAADDAGKTALRVLVIDDEALVARSLRRALRDHDVVIADNGQHALEIIGAGEGFDVVLCDLMMPDVTGMDVYERVEAERPELAPRFVFMTGGAFTARARTFLDRVPNARVDKPFDVARLRELVRSVARDD